MSFLINLLNFDEKNVTALNKISIGNNHKVIIYHLSLGPHTCIIIRKLSQGQTSDESVERLQFNFKGKLYFDICITQKCFRENR